MKRNQSYAIFGLGRYGMAVAEELAKNGEDVIAIDKNEDIVNDAIDRIPICKCGDVTDEDVLLQLGIKNIDTIIISMAENLEASIMATALCKELGAKHIIVKCKTKMHETILRKIGADKTVCPEDESGIRLAKELMHPNISDIFELSSSCSILEIKIQNDWENKTLSELMLRRKYGINVIAIKENDKVITNISPETPLTPNSVLIVIADDKKIKDLL